MATPYMGLDLPVPTVTPGPTYGTQNNVAFEAIDSHDHTPGKGPPVPTAGIDINADLSFGGFNLIAVRCVRLVNNASPLGTPSDLNCLYVSAGNLYYNNNAGQQIQITAGGALNAASVGGIGGDYATSSASLFYTTATTKFTFWQAANTAALVDQGATTIRATGVSANGVTLSAPNALAASYGITFPAALPGATKIVTLSSTGIIGAVYDTDNSSLEISSNTLQVKAAGIVTSMIATSAVTKAKLSAFNYVLSSSSGTFTSAVQSLQPVTNLSATLTTTGRPVVLQIQADTAAPSGTPSYIGWGSGSGGSGMYIELLCDGTRIAYMQLGGPATNNQFWPSIVKFIHFTPSAASHTYTVKTQPVGSGVTCYFYYCQLVAYEKA